ncbi:MAG: hypothetical protein Q8Q09_17830 [Deltaproteobacteria bacterium]|nr:hypothetical protein [Deltaproteobacteria bacterium]
MVRSKTATDTASSSTLLLNEYFDAGDWRFFDELLSSTAARKLQVFAARWYGDRRAFGREALLRYIDDGCDRPGHRPMVKKLFKCAEAAGDDEAMAHFVVVFDRAIARTLSVRKRRGRVVAGALREDLSLPRHRSQADRVGRFTVRTRRYLQRRSWRYFRSVARRDGQEYVRNLSWILSQYTDAQLDPAHRLLDAWSLTHALFWGSDVLRRDPRGIRIVAGQSMSSLRPAPYNEAAWALPAAFEPLFVMLCRANSALVRNWSLALLRRFHERGLRELSLAQVRTLLASAFPQAQTLGAEVLERVSGLERMPVEDWLTLLALDNPYALPMLCRLFELHVTPTRLTLHDCLALAMSRPVPVASLGLKWLRGHSIKAADELQAIMVLSNLPSETLRAEAIEWLVGVLERSEHALAVHLRELLDSRHREVRERAFAALALGGRFADEIELWSALTESPYDDARAFLLGHLPTRVEQLNANSVRMVWATVLLDIHRGSLARRQALTQIAVRITKHPEQVTDLLPLLRIALRSVRAPERRAALAAITQAALAQPLLRAAVQRQIPELTLPEPEIRA